MIQSKNIEVEQTYEGIKLIHKIGSGGFGQVFLAECDKHKSQTMAIKVANMNTKRPEDMIRILREAKFLRECEHKNILKGYQSFFVGNHYFIVMQYCQLGTLEWHIKNNPDLDVDQVINQLIDAVAYLHAHGIVHRDIKPPNILFREEKDKIVVKLADLGIGIKVQNCAKTAVDSQYYTAPQVLQKGQYNSKSDIYSLGVVFIELELHKASKPISITKALDYKVYPQKLPQKLRNEFKKHNLNFIFIDMIHRDPKQRPDIDTLCKLMKRQPYRLQDKKRPPMPKKTDYCMKQWEGKMQSPQLRYTSPIRFL